MSNSKPKVKCVNAEFCERSCRHAHPHERVTIMTPKCHCTEWAECQYGKGKVTKVRCVRVK